MERKEVKKIASQEVKAHEKRMHKGMKKGGVTTSDLKKIRSEYGSHQEPRLRGCHGYKEHGYAQTGQAQRQEDG